MTLLYTDAAGVISDRCTNRKKAIFSGRRFMANRPIVCFDPEKTKT